MTDTSQSSLIRHFPAAVAFIKEGMAKGGVLVHCYAGVSRSASCTIAFLMQEKDMSFQQAFAFASKRRPVIFPNMGFQRQLCEFEKLLHLKKSYSSPNRVDKLTQRVIKGHQKNVGSAAYGGKPEDFLKEVSRQIVGAGRSPTLPPNGKTTLGTITNGFFNQDVPQPEDDYQRVNLFDRSNAFGFSEDKLGRLAEINKTQLE